MLNSADECSGVLNRTHEPLWALSTHNLWVLMSTHNAIAPRASWTTWTTWKTWKTWTTWTIGCVEKHFFSQKFLSHGQKCAVGFRWTDAKNEIEIRGPEPCLKLWSFLQRHSSKNTKEKLTFQFFAFFATFFSILRVHYPIDQFVWSIRFFWYPYRHTLWHFMSYDICHNIS